MAEKERYYQPSNVTDALTEIQKLFNSYRNAPFTQELLDYHRKLIDRLTGDLQDAARAEHRDDLVAAAQGMARAMQGWIQIRYSGQPYAGRLRHFKFVPDATGPKFKRHVVKDHGSGTHRSSRH
ncbi:hypothetical protein LZY01_06270 [Levilactobacillus zymae]|uniref:Uncharacterized protein n=1 Tax=Levilactobacillus zymae TaxID=267363 RepID=A0ABQ0WUF5_9LACO|nr:hypothetical protein [Levilactobacillus zymae]KRL11208.1 hypothetical protein FD38_GL001720 [Levilactobacillus zymae DSM 19395]QFR60104.1 hypothetical protein LZ395_00470 [Levilactobacillus zymae]GEO71459.1 hypothetical protein LZY01_06270 [Levilactobacillus zymae]